MSDDIMIRVEGLSKKYVLGRSSSSERYTALRDVLANAAKAPWRRWRGGAAPGGTEEETFWALRDVDMEVRRGEVVGIIGRNGAGKSTLLKLLSRITEPTSGRIRLRGRVASLLEVGTGFHPELTGRENIFLNGAILGMQRAEIRAKFDEIVEFAEVARFLDTPVKRYSSGMYVRLAFAVAAHLEPEILIVDEVLAVGDVQFQRKCLGKMSEVARGEGRTVLFVSHNMTAIQALCGRGILLGSGQVKFDGGSARATQLYQSGDDPSSATAERGTYDLAKRKNKHADHPIITRVVTRDHLGEATDIIPMGTSLTVEIEVDGLSSHPGAAVGFRLLSEDGTLLADFNTAMQPFGRVAERGRHERLRLHIPEFPFVQGDYKFGISIGIIGHRTIDDVEPVGRLEVSEHDAYGTGYQINRGHSLVLLRGAWDFVEAE